jgi:hypothetical protein
MVLKPFMKPSSRALRKPSYRPRTCTSTAAHVSTIRHTKPVVVQAGAGLLQTPRSRFTEGWRGLKAVRLQLKPHSLFGAC